MSATKRRNVLGRGLDALIPSGPSDIFATGVAEIDLDRIRPNRQQPREHFDADALADLAQSIRENGVIQPLVLRTQGDGFEIVAGERRWRAAQQAGLKRVPAVIKNVADDRLLEVALIENIQRQDLSPLETAKAFRLLVTEHGLTQEEVADRVGMKRPTVANYLRLLTLATPVRRALGEGRLDMGHARALGGLEDEKRQAEACQTVLRQELSVRQTEALVQRLKNGTTAGSRPAGSAHRDPDVQAAERRLQTALGSRVRIVRKARGAGKIEIRFRSEEELDHLFSLLTDDRAEASGAF
jgi:ParB family chromosome partitioning protein